MSIRRYVIMLTAAALTCASVMANEPSEVMPVSRNKNLPSAIPSPSKRLDVLINHLRVVIRDETNQVEAKRLRSFVQRYQDKAVAEGLLDIDRQTQYVLLALYTSGAGIEHPACRALMKNPPKGSDDFADAMQALPDSVWETGKPIWESKP